MFGMLAVYLCKTTLFFFFFNFYYRVKCNEHDRFTTRLVVTPILRMIRCTKWRVKKYGSSIGVSWMNINIQFPTELHWYSYDINTKTKNKSNLSKWNLMTHRVDTSMTSNVAHSINRIFHHTRESSNWPNSRSHIDTKSANSKYRENSRHQKHSKFQHSTITFHNTSDTEPMHTNSASNTTERTSSTNRQLEPTMAVERWSDDHRPFAADTSSSPTPIPSPNTH